MYFIFQTCRIVLHLDYFSGGFFLRYIFILSGTSFVFHSSTYPRFHVQVCASWFAFLTFYFYCNIRRAPAAPPCPALPHPSNFFSSWTVLFDTSGGSLFHRVRKQRVHEVWWLVSGAFSNFLFSTLSWAALFGEWQIYRTRPSLTFMDRRSHACLYRVITCTPFIFLSPFPLPKTHRYTHTRTFSRRENEL